MANENTTPGAKALLPAALVKAQREVQVALKASKNDFHKYRYASAEEVLTVARDALNDNGLSLSPLSENIVPMPAGVTDGAAPCLLHARYILEHEGGESRVIETHVPIVPEKGRPLDKALFGARTESLGYVLRDLLLIPRVDAPDVSGRADRGERPQQPRPVPANPPRQLPDVVFTEALAMTRGVAQDQKAAAWERAKKHVVDWCKSNGFSGDEEKAALGGLTKRVKEAAASNGNGAPAAQGGA